MPKVKSIAEALKIVKQKVEETLLFDVAEVVKDVEIRHVYGDVYSRQKSETYHRRYSNGGIGDRKNIESYIEVEGNTLVVANRTEFNRYLNGVNSSLGYSQNSGQGLDGLIEYGDRNWNGLSYDWAEGEPARPFIQKTIDDLNTNKEHVRALAEGLRKRGINVKTAK